MSGEQSDGEVDQAEASHEPRECMPCRGSGKVISNLGGTPKPVTCPWCDGGGIRLPEVNAQAKWSDPDSATGSDSA